ncbi:D5 N like family, partial [mine drainage metagenome]
RWDIIVFHKPPEIDTTLQDKLKTELPGTLNWMIEGARRIIDNGMKFSNSTPTAEAMQIWEIASNPIRAFYNRCISKEGDKEIAASDYYAAFRLFAETHHAKTVDEDVFDQQFSKISKTGIIRHQRNNVSSRYRKGLRILPEDERLDSDVFNSNECVGYEPD